MALSQNQVQDVCFLNGGHRQCAYLDGEYIEDDNGDIFYVFLCRKKSPPDKQSIDDEITTFLQECKQKGTDPLKQGVALGDNCGGYLPLKTKVQGYDAP